MDNLCHSLAGAAIAQTGFARRLPRATLLAVIAANIPDVDAFVYAFGVDSATAVSFRRGWTHGLPALALWAFAVAAGFAWWNRRRLGAEPPGNSAASASAEQIASALTWRAFLPLAAIAVVSHPVLDWMNTYGVRFLMPFSDRWFYGDTLFIVDPTLLALFGLGWFASSRLLKRASPRAEWPARVALVVALAYVATMKAMSAATRDAATRELALADPTPRTLMVVPRAFTMRNREVVVRSAATYDHYMAGWKGFGPEIGAASRSWGDPVGDDSAMVAAVRATRDGSRFLTWSRFPYFVRDTAAGARTVFVGDTRYSRGTIESWAGIRVLLP